MRRLTSIVALNPDGAIGCQNGLPWRLKTDMKFFRTQTVGNVVIMGRKTWESIGGPLPGRHNVVLSHNSILFPGTSDSEVATSVPEALAKAEKRKSKEVFVVGGAFTYDEMAPFVDRYLVTMVDKAVDNADAFLSLDIFDNEDDWNCLELNGPKWDPTLDEAPFKIFELTHKAPDTVINRRVALVEDYLSKMLNRPSSRRSGYSLAVGPRNVGLQF